MSTDFSKRTKALRKTIRPLNSRQIGEQRMWLAYNLNLEGQSFRAIRQILKLSGPDEARRLVAKANRKAHAISQ